MNNTIQPATPIYGTPGKPCPDPPAGNQKLIEYMNRLQQILVQLAMTKNKATALDRISVLSKEMEITNFSSC
jgi:hypothetical protein